MFQVALISRWHPHAAAGDARYLKQFNAIPDCRVSCVWDEVPARGQAWAEELGVEFEADLDAVLARSDVDGVICTAPTSMHREIFEKAARAGKHIFTEKALALSMEDAFAIRKAVEESGVKFVISFPRIFTKELGYAKQLIESGELGRICRYRVLVGHRAAINGELEDYWFDPEIAGGGSMMDLGCHPAYLALWTLGKPKSIQSAFGYTLGERVEDNANCSVIFENDVLASLESTFTTAMMSVFELSVYGSEGSYYAFMPDGDSVWIKKHNQPVRAIPKAELPEIGSSPMEQWVSACTAGTPIEACGIDEAVEIVRLMVAAYRSAKEGREVRIDEIK